HRGHYRGTPGGALEGALKLWIVILAVGALNYASRLLFIAFLPRPRMPSLAPACDADGADGPDGHRANARRRDDRPENPGRHGRGGRRMVDAQPAENNVRRHGLSLAHAGSARASGLTFPFRFAEPPCVSKAPTPISRHPT